MDFDVHKVDKRRKFVFYTGGKIMPVSMIHLFVAKKVNPDANIDFYVGNLALDGSIDEKLKNKAHFYDVPDREDALRKFALKANNDYLKGMVLHLFADKKFHAFWNENTPFPYQEGEDWSEFEKRAKYTERNRKINSHAYHNTEWAYSLYKEMENWDFDGFVETEYIKKEDVKWFIPWQHERLMKNKLASSSVFPPALVEKLVNDTAEDFNKWFSNLKS